jgi:hypothetical protein
MVGAAPSARCVAVVRRFYGRVVVMNDGGGSVRFSGVRTCPWAVLYVVGLGSGDAC